MQSGSLTIVGTGIMFGGHITRETSRHIETADKVFYGVADAVSWSILTKLNSSAESLPPYLKGRPRQETYQLWVDQILESVRGGLRVCVVFYGHPGVFVYPSHEAIRQARREGFEARMLPGISAEDCLFADLGIEPSKNGIQSYEATDFLLRRRTVDPTSGLLLWQIAIAGHLDYPDEPDREGLRLLAELLETWYGRDHDVLVYEAAQYAMLEPFIHCTTIGLLPDTPISNLSTLYVPPKDHAAVDIEMAGRLGLSQETLVRAFGDER